MMKTAYLLLCIDTRKLPTKGPTTFRDVRFAIYSEEHPTLSSKMFTMCVMQQSHEDLREAIDMIRRQIYRSGVNHLAWIRDLLGETNKIDGVGIDNISFADAEAEMLKWATIAEHIKKRS